MAAYAVVALPTAIQKVLYLSPGTKKNRRGQRIQWQENIFLPQTNQFLWEICIFFCG
jgi:hypothetical protein